MHVHTVRKPVRPVASCRKKNGEMLELFKCKNFFPRRGVCGYLQRILLVLTAIDLEERQTPCSNSPFSAAGGKAFGVEFHTLRITKSKICSVVEQHNVATSNLSRRGLSSGIP